MRYEIACVDDSKLNLDYMETILQKDFSLHTYQKQSVFLNDIGTKPFDCILLDLHMPEGDGFELYEKILAHPKFNGCPIFFVSTDDSEQARIKSLTLGAVDFISRTVPPLELIARIKAKMKFFQSHRNIIEFDGLKINLTLLKTFLGQQEIPLTFIELKLLTLMLRHYPDSLSKLDISENVWKGSVVQDATIHTHVFNLNNKLAKWSYEIQVVKGIGAQLVRKPQ
ncbi:MAG: response regulator transcription factor [Bacteriovoracaceae bacterium]